MIFIQPYWKLKSKLGFDNDEQMMREIYVNKKKLRDLIAATGLVMLLKLNPKHYFFCLSDLEIWQMSS